jgi:hypothetical protein
VGEVAHLGEQRRDASARFLRFFDEPPLIVGERTHAILHEHPKVAGDDSRGGSQLVHGER